ncbi:hypothetical protein ABG067_007581, partial [Albugo candida]
MKSAFEEIEQDEPQLPVRNILHYLKKQLVEVSKEEDDGEKAAVARKYLENWEFLPKFSGKKKENASSSNATYNNNFIINDSINVVVNNQTLSEASQVVLGKRKEAEEVDGRSISSWGSAEPKQAR